ncbi:MAG: nitrilase-related carbon-nitrogen hydrolase [Verrucomicrobiota bacterium]|nr:nitrilase-related carbon-nitrogen hydrolase [Verrucomicrobiota bacterium]
MKVYGIQFDPKWGDKTYNFQEIEQILESSEIKKGSLIILPETFATGFCLNTEITTKDEPKKTSTFLSKLSTRYNSWVAGGLIQKIGQFSFNRFVCFSPQGERVTEYDKIHLISKPCEEHVHTPGNECRTFNLGPFTVCPIICYDLRFPELFRQGTRMGADLFVVIACWPKERIHHWTSLLQARAIENQAFVIGLNRTGREPGIIYNGNSVIFGPKGEIIDKLESEPDILKGEISIDEVENWRTKFPAQEHKRENLFLPEKN